MTECSNDTIPGRHGATVIANFGLRIPQQLENS